MSNQLVGQKAPDFSLKSSTGELVKKPLTFHSSQVPVSWSNFPIMTVNGRFYFSTLGMAHQHVSEVV